MCVIALAQSPRREIPVHLTELLVNDISHIFKRTKRKILKLYLSTTCIKKKVLYMNFFFSVQSKTIASMFARNTQ